MVRVSGLTATRQEQARIVENDDLSGTARFVERWTAPASDARAGMRENATKCFARYFEINRATDSLLAVLGHSVAVAA